jgi:hypothetical protein
MESELSALTQAGNECPSFLMQSRPFETPAHAFGMRFPFGHSVIVIVTTTAIADA